MTASPPQFIALRPSALTLRILASEYCLRCGGLLAKEKHYNSQNGLPFVACRCPICGDIFDQVVLENRYFRRYDYVSRYFRKGKDGLRKSD